jgi:hypothetical protein
MRTKSKKKWVWISAGVLAVLLAFFLLINSILAPVIGRKIAAAVRKAGDGAYTLRFEKIRVNLFSGTVTLSSVRLDADAGRLQDKPFVVSGSAAKIEVTGVKVLDYWWHKKLEIGTLAVEGAAVELSRQKKDTAHARPPETLYQKLSGSLKLVSAGKIVLDDIRFDYADVSNSPMRLKLERVRFEARGLLIDSATQADPSRTLYCKEITAGIRNFGGFAQHGAYHYTIKSTSYSTLSKRLQFNGIAVRPLELNRFFSKMHTDRFELDLDTLSAERFDYQSYLDKNEFYATKISAARGKLNIFGDPSGAATPGDKVSGFPNYALRQVSTQVLVDTVDLSGINVSYSELNRKDGKIGTVEFAGTSGQFLQVSNRSDVLAKDPWCAVQLATHFMRAGQLNLSARFNQSDKACSYRIKGSLGEMPAVAVNPVAMPLGLARVKSGGIRQLDFSIRGDRSRNTGNLGLLYRDVDLEMLSNNYRDKSLKTVLTNTLIIAHNNPDDVGGTPRTARINYTRPVSIPFFCALWQTLSAGIKACVEDKKLPSAVPAPHESLLKKIATAPVRLFKKKT